MYTHVKLGHRRPGQKALSLVIAVLLLRNTIASGSSTLSSPIPIPLQTVTSVAPVSPQMQIARIRDNVTYIYVCIYSCLRSVFIDLLHCTTNLSCNRRVHVSSLSAFHSTFFDAFVVVKRVRYARQCYNALLKPSRNNMPLRLQLRENCENFLCPRSFFVYRNGTRFRNFREICERYASSSIQAAPSDSPI